MIMPQRLRGIRKRIAKISADYNFNIDDCIERNKHSLTSGVMECLTALEKLIAKKLIRLFL